MFIRDRAEAGPRGRIKETTQREFKGATQIFIYAPTSTTSSP